MSKSHGVVTGHLDDTHAASMLAVERIRAIVNAMRADAATWQPRPMPANWGQS